MKANHFRTVCMLALAFLFVFPSVYAGKEKKKKEKKSYQWVMPEKLSGEEDMDRYLLSCDTLWNKIQTYRDSIHFFTFDTIPVINKETNTQEYAIKIVDENGTERGFAQSLQQGLDMVFTGTNILLDAANISLLTTSAGMSLTSNPLLAFSYGKYLKAGPQIVKLSYNEVKEIVTRTKGQISDMKSIHKNKLEGSTDKVILVPIPEGEEVDPADLVDIATIDMGTDELGELPAEIDNLPDIDTLPDPEKDKKE